MKLKYKIINKILIYKISISNLVIEILCFQISVWMCV